MATGDLIVDFSHATARDAYGEKVDALDEHYRIPISFPKGPLGGPVDWRTFLGYTSASLGASGDFSIEVLYRVNAKRDRLANNTYTGAGAVRFAASIKPLPDSAVVSPAVSGGTMVASTITLDATPGEIKLATIAITYAQAGSLDKNKAFVLRIGRDSGNTLDTCDAPVEIVGLAVKQG